MPLIDHGSATPLYVQLYEQIAHGIESGQFPAGKKLPSIRECARELDVSNTTVELAYQRLVAEGYVQARRGSGYTICPANAKAAPAPANAQGDGPLAELVALGGQRATGARPAYDFSYDAVDGSVFPYAAWARICREVFFAEGAEGACLYNDPQGLRELRAEIAHYLGSELGLSCVAEQVLVMPTTRDLVAEVATLFTPGETAIAMEDPGYDEVGRRLSSRGYRVQRLAMHPFPTWDEARAQLEGADIAFCTPACQFPTNRPLPAEARTALVDWVQKSGAYIIDDEYGWEFLSGVARMPPLAALDDAGRVVTLGTFSNSFTPAVCLSYAVLPPGLMLRWQEANRGHHPRVPWQTQAAMAAFMREGAWRKHVRKMRTAMLAKRAALLDALRARLGNAVEIREAPGSLFALVQTRDGRPEAELVEAAASAGVRVYPTSRYWHAAPPPDWRYVQVGYAGIPLSDIAPGINSLARAWGL